MQRPNRALNTYRHRWILPDGTDEHNLACYLSKPIIIAQFLMACWVVSQFYVPGAMEDTASPKVSQLPSATTAPLVGLTSSLHSLHKKKPLEFPKSITVF